MANTKDLILESFRRFDANADGTISKAELSGALLMLGNDKFNDASIDLLMKAADVNKDGKIQYKEFVDWVMQDTAPKGQDVETSALDRRGEFNINFKSLLPERFEVDVTSRYELDRMQIGEGGYGKVYVAVDKEFNNRRVAVKKVTKRSSSGPSNQEQDEALKREIAVMKELDHPNICKLFGTFERGNTMFFIMELCEGGEVFDRIIESGKISEKFTAQIIEQVVDALAYVHGRGIAHRDLKPENIVFCSKDRSDQSIKVIDWGLAMCFTGTPMTSAVGSFTYAAPEVILSRNIKAYTAACDLWSLGVLTYVMLCGKPPFWGSEANHLRNARHERYPITGAPWDTMNPQAIDFVKVLIKADPNKRMAIDALVQHEWLNTNESRASAETTAGVFGNLKQFSNANTFSKMCITAVARHLDHKDLKGIHQVFRDIDVNGDGVLCSEEIGNGFRRIFGENSEEAKKIDSIFKSLDLDGSNSIDYTEFCAAGLGQRATTQDDVTWAAFKTFDIDNSGFVERSDINELLDRADVRDAWSSEVCQEVAMEIVAKFDKDGDGKICFEDWKKLMRDAWDNHNAPVQGENPTAEGGISAYELLAQVNKLPAPKDEE
jgi:calcium-dependent protein kinase